MFRIEYKYRMQFVLLQFVLQLVLVPLSLNVQEESCHESMHDPVDCLPEFLGVVTISLTKVLKKSVLIMMLSRAWTAARFLAQLRSFSNFAKSILIVYFYLTSTFGHSLRFRNFLVNLI